MLSAVISSKASQRSYFLLTLLFAALLLSGYQIAGRTGLIWGFLAVLIFHWITFFYGDQKLLNLFPCRKLEGQDPWGISEHLHALSYNFRLPVPQVFITEAKVSNAYSVARNHNHSSIVLSSHLLQNLTDEERKALLTYLFVQIRDLKTVSLSLSSSLLSFLWLPFYGLSSLAPSKPLAFLLKLWSVLIAPIAVLTRSFILINDFYTETDEEVVRLTENPEAWARALLKIHSYAQAQDISILPCFSHIFVVNPLTPTKWSRYFQAQPRIEKRIQRLAGRYPI